MVTVEKHCFRTKLVVKMSLAVFLSKTQASYVHHGCVFRLDIIWYASNHTTCADQKQSQHMR